MQSTFLSCNLKYTFKIFTLYNKLFGNIEKFVVWPKLFLIQTVRKPFVLNFPKKIFSFSFPFVGKPACRRLGTRKGIGVGGNAEGKGGYFPSIILFISFSLFNASIGVKLFTSKPLISSRICSSTGSSN